MQLLYETYENVSKAGIEDLKPQLYPIAHTTQNADVEVWITVEGTFLQSFPIVEKEQKKTLIPCSEASANRSGKYPKAHPLFDKLQYLAGDYAKFGGEKGETFHLEYMEQLAEWCGSDFANVLVCSIYEYLKKGTLICDLIQYGTLIADENTGVLLDKWNGTREDAPPIFKAVIGSQKDSFIRFRVQNHEGDIIEVWNDKKVQEDYISYYLSKQTKQELCYVTGKKVACSANHSSKIRNTGDKAKLISANDTSGFTFRGRFTDADQVVQVGYDVSQKSHNALKWLIEKQGITFGDKVFLLWGTQNESLPRITEDSEDCVDLFGEEEEAAVYTEDEFANRFQQALNGYRRSLEHAYSKETKIALIALDAATTGRLSITFYREYYGVGSIELFNSIEKWHMEGEWCHQFKMRNGKPVKFVGMPSLKDIALVAFGTERNGKIDINAKLSAQTVQRLLACVVDEEAKLPSDIVKAAVQRAKHPQNYKEEYNWKKVITVTCSLVKKYEKERKGEEWKMSLNTESNNLAYNCGRLLAVADAIERRTFYLAGENARQTNAMRYFTKFAASPCSTWIILSQKLLPYIERLGKRGNDLLKLKQEIATIIPEDEFRTIKNLDGCMVLGFDAQCKAIIYHEEEKEDE